MADATCVLDRRVVTVTVRTKKALIFMVCTDTGRQNEVGEW